MLYNGDCLEVLKEIPDNSVDAIVTDPPYELGFMGKSWDSTGIANNIEMWSECLRVLKPGGHLLSFGGDRTHHRMMVAIEDAGFEIRTTVCWVFGQGFPKSLNVAKQIQKKLSLKSDDICSCGQNPKSTTQGSQSDCQGHRHFYDEQPLAVQGSDQYVSPLQVYAHEHSHVYRNEDAPFEQSNDSDHFQKDKHHLSSDDFSHEVQHPSKDYRVSDNVQSDKSLNKSNEQLTVEHKKASGKLDKLHLGDDLVSSYKDKLSIIDTVYQNLPQCEACKKIILPKGLGTALKPALEFICMARKPLGEKTVAENCIKWGTGGINIDISRIPAYIDGDNSENIVLSHKLSELRGKLHTLLFSCVADKKDCPTPASDVECVEMWKKLVDYLGDCSPYSRLYDELSHLFLKGDQVSVEQLHDALGDIDRLRKEQNSSLSNLHTDHLSNLDDFYQLILSYLNDTTLYIKKQENLGRKNNVNPYGSSRTWSISNTPPQDNTKNPPTGRFPANLIHDNSEEVRGCFPEVKGATSRTATKPCNATSYSMGGDANTPIYQDNTTNASRFFKSIIYTSKASKRDRGEGNNHPTVKSTALMEYLINMVTPPNGTVLDPFMGSGSTGVACKNLNRDFIGIELETEYFEIAKNRIENTPSKLI